MSDIPMQAVALTPYEWHILLRDLEYLMSICNRANSNLTTSNYQRISSQLNAVPIEVRDITPKREEAHTA